MGQRSAFGGGDQAYLRDDQYRDGSKLDARTNLHRLYSSAEPFPDFVGRLIDWSAVTDVLECGCGTGRLWENQLAPKDIALTVTDLSPGMVTAAIDHAEGQGFTNVDGAEHDIQHLPFPDHSFDLVVANHMLYHVPDPALALAEVARVLRPHGVFVASTNGHGHMAAIKTAVEEVFGPQHDDLYTCSASTAASDCFARTSGRSAGTPTTTICW